MELLQRYKYGIIQPPFLCEEILVEILKRLPTKSLLRFKTVSKSWYSLITSPTFIYIHSNFINHPDRRRLLVIRDYGNDKSIHSLVSHEDGHVTYPICASLNNLLDDYPRMTMIGTPVNGIYTLSLDREELQLPLKTLALALWNMSTRDVHILPHISHPEDVIEYQNTRLFKYLVNYGFGFDSSVSDYKVVVISAYSSFNPDVCVVSCFQIYSLSKNTWESSDITPIMPIPSSADVQDYHDNESPYMSCLGTRGYYLNNACHWEYTYFSPRRKFRCIVCFDLKDQVFRLFTLPTALAIKKSDYALTSADGSLGLVCSVRTTSLGETDPLSEFNTFELWCMREYGVDSSWSKLYNIITPFRITKKIFFGVVDKKIYIRRKKSKHIRSYSGERDDDRCHRYYFPLPKDDRINILPYSESLVPIKPTSTTLRFI